MKVLISFVIYYPKGSFYQKLVDFFNSPYNFDLCVFDNTPNSDFWDHIENHNLKYISPGKNMGIGYALKAVMDYANEKNYDYVFTLDQDSIIESDDIIAAEQVVFRFSDYGIIGLNYNNKYKSHKKILDKKFIITSGSFISVKQYKRIQGFNENLFIDYVDFELCWQFWKKRIKVGLIPAIDFRHTIGSPIIKTLFFIKIKSLNHNPIRYYYRYRNELYCYLKDRRFFFFQHIKEKLQIITMLLLEGDKKEKLKKIQEGKRDCRRNHFGEYDG